MCLGGTGAEKLCEMSRCKTPASTTMTALWLSFDKLFTFVCVILQQLHLFVFLRYSYTHTNNTIQLFQFKSMKINMPWCLGHPHSLPDCNWTSRRQEEREDGTEELRHRPGRGLTAPDCRVVLGEEFSGVTWGWIVVTWFAGGGLFFSYIIIYPHISISIVSIYMFIYIYLGMHPFPT